MRPSRYRILTLLAALAMAPAAHAMGPGIRLGDRLLLHLGLGTEFRYDSNVFFSDTSEQGVFLFRLTPTVDLATKGSAEGPHSVDFRLHAGMDYTEFLTSNANINRHRSFGVQVSGLLTILPGYKFSI